MKSKLGMFIYVIFVILSFLFGVYMFKVGDILRGILFMVAVACWGMCIYNNSGINKREKQRNISSAHNAMANKTNKNIKKQKS